MAKLTWRGTMYKKHIERIFLLLLVLIVVVSFISDVLNLTIINIELSTSEFYDLILTLFGIQASISTLGIALIALLIESIKEKKYGIRIGYFVMTNHIKMLTHQFIIIIEILILFASYITLLFKMLNLTVALFSVSLLLIVFLTMDILKLFVDREKINQDIRNYIVETINTIDNVDSNNIFIEVNDHLNELAYERKIMEFRENIDLYYFLYTNANEENRNIIEDNFENLFNRLSYYESLDINEELYKAILKMYQIANIKGFYVKFINNLLLQLFEVLSSLPQKYYNREYDFPYISFYKEMKDNEQFYEGDKGYQKPQTITFAKNIYELMFKTVNWKSSFREVRVNAFYDILYNDYKIGQNENELQELNEYTKSLINNKENLPNFFLKLETQYYGANPAKQEHFIIMLSYMFYILYDNVDSTALASLKPYIKQIIDENNVVSSYLSQVKLEDIPLDSVHNNISSQLTEWEFFPDTSNGMSSKYYISEKVTITFLICLFIGRAVDKIHLKKYIKSSKINLSIIYNYTIGDKETFERWYDQFLEYFMQYAFYDKIEAFDLLRESLNDLLIEEEITRVANTDEELMLQEVVKSTNTVKDLFDLRLAENFSNDDSFEKNLEIERKGSEILPIDSFSEIQFIEDYVLLLCKMLTVGAIYKQFKEELLHTDILEADLSEFEIILNELDSSSSKYDLTIGSLNLLWYSREPIIEEIQDRISEMDKKLRIKGMNAELIVLSSRDIKVTVEDLTVSFYKTDKQDIISHTSKIGDKFKIKENMVSKPLLFTYEEIEQYFLLKFRKVEWNMKLKVEYNSDLEGIIFQLNEE